MSGDGLDEVGVLQAAGLVEGPPHQALRDARGVDRQDVEHDADGRHPEVGRHELLAPERRLEEPRQQPVHHAEGHEAVPAQGAGVHVGDGPVGVVAEALTLLIDSIGPSKVTCRRR
jgi:hypothetical protein